MTDVTLEYFRAGTVTSATAMMWMEDTERAAELALDAGLPTGLHLNLTQPFEGASAPPQVRERQLRLTERFQNLALLRWIYDPRMSGLVKSVVADQFERFQELYGRAPTHVDGHRQAHLALNVVLGSVLPEGIMLRRAKTMRETPPRRLRHALVSRRFHTTDVMLPIGDLYGDGPERLPERLAVAREHTVEVMTHPAWKQDREWLGSSEWAAAVSELPVGSFADLPAR
jgi:predicted glycoside hydrolase/deacetylase ChbG (UPF0249 family)